MTPGRGGEPHRLPALPGGGSTLGVLGGGQLGRMFVHAAQALGFRVAVLEPDAASPAGAAADRHFCAEYTDIAALEQLAAACAAVTTEFENVPATALRRLERSCRVAPPAAAVETCQHRAREKACFTAAGVPCAPHAVIGADPVATPRDEPQSGSPQASPRPAPGEPASSAASDTPAHLWPHAFAQTPQHGASKMPDLVALLPGILKTASLGYDGKGQATVTTAADLPAAWAALGRVPCVLERRLALSREISVIVARAADGACVHLPVQQNLHRAGILAVTQAPAPDVDAATAAQAVGQAQRLAAALDYVGVLCVEFFVLDDGTLVANEMAPRPHNSGHYSIDACDVSQFELQVRTLAGLPLVQPRLHSPAVMLNLLGDLWFDGAAPSKTTPTTSTTRTPHPAAGTAGVPRDPDWPAVLALPGVHLHLYGKAQPRRGRKMGHLTVTAPDAAAARATALQVAQRLGLPDF